MLERLLQYLEESNIAHEMRDDVLVIGGKTCYVCSEVGDKIISSDLNLLDYNLTYDWQVYIFGGVWYYSEDEHANLNVLEYVGPPQEANFFTSFLGVHGAMDILSGSRLY